MEKEILKSIEDSSSILIITHVNPDGDTLGCASALKSYIGEKADILIQIKDNFNFPKTYSFLPYLNYAKNLSDIKDEYDLIVALDVASVDRIIDKARALFDKAQNTISIDHHQTNKNYAKLEHKNVYSFFMNCHSIAICKDVLPVQEGLLLPGVWGE